MHFLCFILLGRVSGMIESIIFFLYGGTTLSVIGIIIYLGISSITNKYIDWDKRLYRFLYSVTFSVLTYIISFSILNSFEITSGLGFADISPISIVSTIFIYIGTLMLTKNSEIM